MKIKDIITVIESRAPLSFQEDYDNSGLIIGDSEQPVEKALICFDVTMPVIQEAIDKKCQLIISHHPLIFNPLKRLQNRTYIEKVIIAAIKNDLAIYAAHTNIDNAMGGLNTYFAELLNLKKVKILKPVKDNLRKLVTFCPVEHSGEVRTAICNAGAGHIGDYDFCTFNLEGKGTFRASDNTNPFVGNKNELHFEKETRIETIYPAYLEKKILTALFKAHPYEEVAYDIYPLKNEYANCGSGVIGELENNTDAILFLKELKEKLKLKSVKYSDTSNKKVKKVALCGGSGSFLIQEAKSARADIFISAEFKYNHFLDVQNEMIIADIGHYESEHFVKELIYNIINKKIPNFALIISEKDINPVNYL